MDQNSTPPDGGSDRPPEENPSQAQGQPPSPPNPGQPSPGYVPPPPTYAPQEGQVTQAQPQGPYVAPPVYPQAQQGYPPQGAPPPGYPPQDYGPPKKRSGMPVWGWILIAIGGLGVLICALVFASLFYFTRQASTRIEQAFSSIGSGLDIGGLEQVGVALDFYDNLESHDYDAAHALLASQLAEKYTSDDLRTRWEALEKTAGKVTPGFPDVTDTSSDQASITQELLTSQGKTYTVKLTVGKVDSIWKITEADPDLIPSP